MFAVFGLVVGLAGGAIATAAWLLSEPPDATTTEQRLSPNSRLNELRTRFDLALAEGKRAGAETEARLRQEFETRRRQSKRPGSS